MIPFHHRIKVKGFKNHQNRDGIDGDILRQWIGIYYIPHMPASGYWLTVKEAEKFSDKLVSVLKKIKESEAEND